MESSLGECWPGQALLSVAPCHRLPVRTQDISPLENMHVSNTFRVAYTTPGADFAEALPLETRNVLRASTIELILGEQRIFVPTVGLKGSMRASNPELILDGGSVWSSFQQKS